ncbi:MAG: NUDIX domain-containing protein [Bacteroidetes bacterium]|nr:NUDIX domain-containing protein [Bacteroidota bacterium]
MPEKLSFQEFRNIYGKVPRLCVDLFMRGTNGFLLSLRDIEPGKGLWHMPGGTVLMGENIRDALARIASEETNLKIKIVDRMGVMEFNKKENPFYHTVSLVYEVEIISGNLKGSEQGKQLKFFNEIPEKMIPEQKEFLKHFL